MNLYRQLDHAYQHLTRHPRPAWLAAAVPGCDLDDAVAVIRHAKRDTTDADTMLRTLISVGRREPDALTVALHALAPRLRAHLGRTITDDYRSDVLTELAVVLVDSPLDRPRLADRLVNRATTAPTRPPCAPTRAAPSTSPLSPPATPSTSPDTRTTATTSPRSSPAASTSPASTPPSRPRSTTAACRRRRGPPTATTDWPAPSTPAHQCVAATSGPPRSAPPANSNPSSTRISMPHDPPTTTRHRDHPLPVRPGRHRRLDQPPLGLLQPVSDGHSSNDGGPPTRETRTSTHLDQPTLPTSTRRPGEI